MELNPSCVAVDLPEDGGALHKHLGDDISIKHLKNEAVEYNGISFISNDSADSSAET